jgi:hypothetical protein
MSRHSPQAPSSLDPLESPPPRRHRPLHPFPLARRHVASAPHPLPPSEQRQDGATPTDTMGGSGAGARGRTGSRGPAALAGLPPYASARWSKGETLLLKVVALDRGAYPRKLGRWRGFLDQSADGSFRVQG